MVNKRLNMTEKFNIAWHELAIVDILIHTIRTNRDINEAFADCIHELRKLVDVDWASIILAGGEGVSFYTISSRVDNASELGEAIPTKVMSTAWLAANKKAFIEPSLEYEGALLAAPYLWNKGLSSVAYLPLLDDKKVFGALIIAGTRPNAYNKKKLALLEHINLKIAAAIRIVQLFEIGREKRTRLEMEEKERLLFLNALAHELKTPLTAIVASAGLLIEELSEQVESPQLRLTKNIIRAVDKLEARLSELIDMAKIGSLSFKLSFELVDILPIIQDVVSELSPVAAENKQYLNVKIPTSVPMVWADKKRLEQVLINLVTNAMKFTWDGDEIQIILRKNAAKLVVEVKDNGPGISKEEKERIFQPYYRIETDRQRFPGLGLGLALSKQLIELHGGSLMVKSTIGVGSIFYFSLPIKHRGS
ncbi:ATP-binding protein [Chloroflexota bacterium]